MSERKVLNKYYPPDFDPSKIPRMKLAKNRQYTVRLMAPFNMRCVTCGEYIYKGKKFNARKEDVENETYLGIRIYRFYIKCTRCLQEISFKTDPQNTDYEIEAGATRNFMALKLAEEQARKEEEELREEEANNPMKLLENRTQQSRNEIELLESLEELRDLNRRQQSIDYDRMLQQFDTTETAKEREERLARLDEEYIKTMKFEQSKLNNKRRVAEEEIIESVEMRDDDKNKRVKIDDSMPVISSSSSVSSTNANIRSSLKPKIIGSSTVTSKTKLQNLVRKKEVTSTTSSVTTVVEKKSDIPLPIATTITSTVTSTGTSLGLLCAYSDSDGSTSD